MSIMAAIGAVGAAAGAAKQVGGLMKGGGSSGGGGGPSAHTIRMETRRDIRISKREKKRDKKLFNLKMRARGMQPDTGRGGMARMPTRMMASPVSAQFQMPSISPMGMATSPYPMSEFDYQVGGNVGGYTPVSMDQGMIPELLERFGPSALMAMPGMGAHQPHFYQAPASVRPQRELTAINPSTGRTHTWLHAGRPVLYTGDLATCKRVNKIAARAKSRSRKR